MKKFNILSILALTSIALIYSCSTEEEDSTPPPSVVATPEPEPPAPTQYTLTVTASEGGTVSTEGGTYDEGTEVTITATPDEGYEFIGWEGSDSTSESLTITLNSSQTIQALFELTPIYTLTVTTSEGGTVSTEGGEYQEGTEVEITATPDEDYHFIGFEGIEGYENTITVNINENKTIEPIFIRKDNGSKLRNNSKYDESELDYLASENFIVWWDRVNTFYSDRSFVAKAITILNNAEQVLTLCVQKGMEVPVGSENMYLNIFLFDNWNNETDVIGIEFDNGGVGTDGNNMPFIAFSNAYFNSNGNDFQTNNTQPERDKSTLWHETFHVMQHKGTVTENTFPYSLENTMYVEATARWFERKYAYPEVFDGNWYDKYNGVGALNLQPQISFLGRA